ncbi:MAG: ABC transporter permease [Deinococcales bacterium]
MRFLQLVLNLMVILLGVSALVFSLMYLAGDPSTALLPKDSPAEAIRAFRERQGFDQGLVVQYGRFLQRAIQGDFGDSLRYREAALPLVLSRFWRSFKLISLALTLALMVAIPLAMLAAIRPHRFLDALITTLLSILQSMPSFVTAQLMIIFFALVLHWFPLTSTSWRALVLPIITLALYPLALLFKVLRESLIENLAQDYIRSARAKGIGMWLIFHKHALKNALIPMLAALSVEYGALLMGAVIVESIFSYPGMGRLLVEALSSRDIPLVQAFVALTALFIALLNGLTLGLARLLDPRLLGD